MTSDIYSGGVEGMRDEGRVSLVISSAGLREAPRDRRSSRGLERGAQLFAVPSVKVNPGLVSLRL